MAKKTITQRAAAVPEKVADFVDNLLLWLEGLKKAALAGEVEKVREILIAHEINGDLAEIIILVPVEAARLKKIIGSGDKAEEIAPLQNKLHAFHMARPETVEAAEAMAVAEADCKKRLSQAEQLREAARVAIEELRGLESNFPEITGKLRGKDIDHFAPVPAIFYEALKKVDGTWRRGESWRDAFRRPAAPQKRRRLVAAGGQDK